MSEQSLKKPKGDFDNLAMRDKFRRGAAGVCSVDKPIEFAIPEKKVENIVFLSGQGCKRT